MKELTPDDIKIKINDYIEARIDNYTEGKISENTYKILEDLVDWIEREQQLMKFSKLSICEYFEEEEKLYIKWETNTAKEILRDKPVHLMICDDVALFHPDTVVRKVKVRLSVVE